MTVEPISRRAEVVLAGYVCPDRNIHKRGGFSQSGAILPLRLSTLAASMISAMQGMVVMRDAMTIDDQRWVRLSKRAAW